MFYILPESNVGSFYIFVDNSILCDIFLVLCIIYTTSHNSKVLYIKIIF